MDSNTFHWVSRYLGPLWPCIWFPVHYWHLPFPFLLLYPQRFCSPSFPPSVWPCCSLHSYCPTYGTPCSSSTTSRCTSCLTTHLTTTGHPRASLREWPIWGVVLILQLILPTLCQLHSRRAWHSEWVYVSRTHVEGYLVQTTVVYSVALFWHFGP